MKYFRVFTHLIVVAIITVITGFIYTAVQQNYRMNANDPQLQIARDISYRLKRNLPVEYFMPQDTIELSQSTGAFVELFNHEGQILVSTATLDGKIPVPPVGVFDYVKSHDEDLITWQPRNGIRIATVIKAVQSYKIGYVVAGRSMSEIENRISNLTWMAFICWLICIAITLVHYVFQIIIMRKKPHRLNTYNATAMV